MMRATLVLLSLLVCAITPLRSGAQEAFDTRPAIAVLPFSNGGSFGPDKEDLTALEVGVQQLLLTELVQNESLRIVERSRLREILEEQALVTSGQVDPRTAARIGRLVGARYVVIGGFMEDSGRFRLNGRVVDVETSEVLKAHLVQDRRQNLYEMLVDLADRITRGVNLPPLPAPVAEQRRTREIPPEAVVLYSRALVYQDGGRREQAIELYRQLADRFPEMTEAREALRQLDGG
jgi:TolB-like protein